MFGEYSSPTIAGATTRRPALSRAFSNSLHSCTRSQRPTIADAPKPAGDVSVVTAVVGGAASSAVGSSEPHPAPRSASHHRDIQSAAFTIKFLAFSSIVPRYSPRFKALVIRFSTGHGAPRLMEPGATGMGFG